MNKEMESQKRELLSQEKNEIVCLNVADLNIEDPCFNLCSELEQEKILGGRPTVCVNRVDF
jgi:hypothetical protein